MLGFFSSRLNWDSPIPSLAEASVSPPLVRGVGGCEGCGSHSLAEEGVGCPNSDEGTDTVVL